LDNNFNDLHLIFDPITEITDIIRNYFNSIVCDNTTLANKIIQWGCSVKPSLTLLIGPSSSGKTTLIQFIQSLYGPYVAFHSIHNTQDIDYKLVRTYFYDDDDNSILDDEETIRNHPCDHLVIVCKDKNIKITKNYGDRIVNSLIFHDSIKQSNCKSDIINKITTLKQLGSTLGWCLENSTIRCHNEDYATSGFRNIFRGNCGIVLFVKVIR